MEIIDYVCELLKLSKDKAIKNSKKIDENLTYYWNPMRGGISLIVDNDGNYLATTSSVNYDVLLEEFQNGNKNKTFFKNS